MRLLLDTHTFLWWLDGDRRLPARVIAQAQLERVPIASDDEVFEEYGVPLYW